MRSDSSYRVPVIPPSSRRTLFSSVTLITFTALVTTGGCSASPEPKPTPTSLFASEEEAFAAAEEVYREYNEAGSRGDNTTKFLTGTALESELETLRYLEENSLVLEGASVLTGFKAVNASPSGGSYDLDARVCLDLSSVAVLDQNGDDITPPERADSVSLTVSFVPHGKAFLISSSETSEELSC